MPPVAVTVNVAVDPAHAVWSVGFAEIDTAAPTTKLPVVVASAKTLLGCANTVKEVVAGGVPDDVESVNVEFDEPLPVKLNDAGENEAVTPDGSTVLMDKLTVLAPGLPPSVTLTV